MTHREREVIHQVHVECKYIFIYSRIIKMKEHRVKPSSIPKASVGGKRNSMRIPTQYSLYFALYNTAYTLHHATESMRSLSHAKLDGQIACSLDNSLTEHRMYDKMRFHSMYFHFYISILDIKQIKSQYSSYSTRRMSIFELQALPFHAYNILEQT